METQRRNFLGLIFAGAAAATARAIPIIGGEPTKTVKGELILPESLAAAAGDQPLLVTNMDDPRVKQYTTNCTRQEWFGALDSCIDKLPDSQYIKWLDEHLAINEKYRVGSSYVTQDMIMKHGHQLKRIQELSR